MATKMTQKDIVLKHLKEHGSISSLECYDRYKIVDLQHYIHVLRRKENYNITDEWKTSKNKKPYKVYTLIEN